MKDKGYSFLLVLAGVIFLGEGLILFVTGESSRSMLGYSQSPCGQETHAATVEFSGTKIVPERCCPQITVSVTE